MLNSTGREYNRNPQPDDRQKPRLTLKITVIRNSRIQTTLYIRFLPYIIVNLLRHERNKLLFA